MTGPAFSAPAVGAATWQPARLLSSEVRFATWIAFFAWAFAVYDFILFGTLLPLIGQRFGWDVAHQAAVATWVAVGTAVVALAIGPLVDRFGRRAGVMVTVGGAAVCSALTAVAGALGSVPLTLIRSLSGLGYAEQGVNGAYLAELYAASDDPRLTRRRGFIYSLVQGGWPIGALLAAALTALLLPLIGWQGCFVFAAVPSLVIAVLARRLRESPQFALQRELRRLRNAGQQEAALRLAQEQGISYEEHAAAGIGAAFHGTSLRATLALGGGIFLNWFAIQIFSVLGSTVITSVHKVSFQNALLVLVLSNVVGYCGYLAHGFLGDALGRRNVIALGWVLGGIAFTAMLYGPSTFGVVVALYSVGLFFLIGPYAALLFFVGESYPTAIRGTGAALINAMGPIGAVVGGFGATAMLNSGSDWRTAAFLFGAIPCVLSGLLVLSAQHVNPADVR